MNLHKSVLSSAVRGMTKWNPELFKTSVKFPFITVDEYLASAAQKILKDWMPKVPNLARIREHGQGTRMVLLDPEKVKDIDDMPKVKLEQLGVSKVSFVDLGLNIDNLRVPDILEAVLPEGANLSSYSTIGHVAHVNLKDHHLPQKHVIGEILLLLKNIRTVVNKTDGISSKFRNFSMEVLAGEEDNFVVEVKENRCTFRFDFSKVYWNPRLCTEHERIVDMIAGDDIVVDVFAGVGPFALPCAVVKKCQRVLANDLNPESFHWLQHNVALNKCKDRFECYNLDGREFITTVASQVLTERRDKGDVHVIMNLPADAISFLDAFCGIAGKAEKDQVSCPLIHVYGFSKEADPVLDVRDRCRKAISIDEADLGDSEIKVSHVRNVAPNKEMMRASFRMPKTVILGWNTGEPTSKKAKTSGNDGS